MKAMLKSIWTIDGGDPSTFAPEDASFSLRLRLSVGPSDAEGSESFDLLVCSPAWLATQCERDGFVTGRHHFIVNEYRFDFVRETLNKLINQYSGASWSEVGAKVARLGCWEFEDYVS